MKWPCAQQLLFPSPEKSELRGRPQGLAQAQPTGGLPRWATPRRGQLQVAPYHGRTTAFAPDPDLAGEGMM